MTPGYWANYWGLPLFVVMAIWAFMFLIAVWEAVWKGIALWRAGRNGHKSWFIAIFILNTLGILPIIYVLGFSKRGQSNEKS